MELLWTLAADAPAVVIEANFRPRSEYERAKLSGLAAQPVEVYCACSPEIAVRRYNARVTHPVHVVTMLRLEQMAEYDRPVGIGGLVTVDTTIPVDTSVVAAAVRKQFDPAISLRNVTLEPAPLLAWRPGPGGPVVCSGEIADQFRGLGCRRAILCAGIGATIVPSAIEAGEPRVPLGTC